MFGASTAAVTAVAGCTDGSTVDEPGPDDPDPGTERVVDLESASFRVDAADPIVRTENDDEDPWSPIVVLEPDAVDDLEFVREPDGVDAARSMLENANYFRQYADDVTTGAQLDALPEAIATLEERFDFD